MLVQVIFNNPQWGKWSLQSRAVDVSFLAVPGIDKGDVGSQSATTVVIYVSLLSVVGSLLSSLLLARQRRAQDDSATGAVRRST